MREVIRWVLHKGKGALALVALVVYGVVRVQIGAFYYRLGVTPQDVGLSELAILGRAAFYFVAVAAVIVLFGALWVRTMLDLIDDPLALVRRMLGFADAAGDRRTGDSPTGDSPTRVAWAVFSFLVSLPLLAYLLAPGSLSISGSGRPGLFPLAALSMWALLLLAVADFALRSAGRYSARRSLLIGSLTITCYVVTALLLTSPQFVRVTGLVLLTLASGCAVVVAARCWYLIAEPRQALTSSLLHARAMQQRRRAHRPSTAVVAAIAGYVVLMSLVLAFIKGYSAAAPVRDGKEVRQLLGLASVRARPVCLNGTGADGQTATRFGPYVYLGTDSGILTLYDAARDAPRRIAESAAALDLAHLTRPMRQKSGRRTEGENKREWSCAPTALIRRADKSGAFVIASASGSVEKPISGIIVRLRSRPHQKASGRWGVFCVSEEEEASESGSYSGTTPFDRNLRLPLEKPETCTAWTTGGLDDRGVLEVALLKRY